MVMSYRCIYENEKKALNAQNTIDERAPVTATEITALSFSCIRYHTSDTGIKIIKKSYKCQEK